MLQSVLSKTPEQTVAERPLCPNCGRGMRLYCVQPIDAPDYEERDSVARVRATENYLGQTRIGRLVAIPFVA